MVHFSGHQYLRHRLVLSLLSGKPIKIDKIRTDDKNPGLRGVQIFLSETRPYADHNALPVDYEVSLLRLLEKATNGTIIEISFTGA